MLETKLLGGKIEIKKLQVVHDPAQRTETLARFITPGGELAVLTDGATSLMHLGYLELKPNIVRGNHYHKKRHERIYIIAGETLILAKDLETGEFVKISLKSGDYVWINPNVAHAILPSTAGHALEFAPEAYDPTDVFRTEPLQNALR